MIYHITTRTAWETALQTCTYQADTLATQGFIHCSTLSQVIGVANSFFHNQPGLVILCIDETCLQSLLRYEDLTNEGKLFPHIYGPLNINAVRKVLSFSPGEQGTFTLPPDLL